MKRILIVITGLVIIGGGMLYSIGMRQQKSEVVQSLVSQEALAGLVKKDMSGIDTSHLAPGLLPPTNKWFSGIALQKDPKKVFPTPLSFLPSNNSFTLDLPKIQTTEKSILAAGTNPTKITIDEAQYYLITRYDELSVDLTYYKNNETPLAVVTLTSGSPYIFYKSLGASSFSVNAPVSQTSSNLLKINGADTTTYAEAHEGASFKESGNSISAKLIKDSFISFYALPESVNSSHLKDSSGARIIGTEVKYEKNSDNYTTTLTLKTHNNQATILGFLPHQKHSQKNEYTLDTLYGEQQFVKNKTFAFTTPVTPAIESLTITKAATEDKELLSRQLRLDINATQFMAEDTYFGGKQLYRAAQLLQLAKELDQEEVADTIQQKIRSELTTWLKVYDGRAKKVFYYDTKIKGVVGETASFGSQEFNDHHFHYGYFIYAASVLSKYDADFKAQYSPAVNLLVADIANFKSEESFPVRRNFDPYFGHSWASGSSPFDDGNNQESISEAINAWVGVQLWAKETNNPTLEDEAGWMLSNEYQSALSYWLQYDTSKAPYTDTYTRSISPLNWGGKRDYATFFSVEPTALLGILLIPMNPTMMHLKQLDGHIPMLLKEAAANPGPNPQFADYLLMLQSLVDTKNALETAKALPDTAIDDANSRSYLYGWIMSAKSSM